MSGSPFRLTSIFPTLSAEARAQRQALTRQLLFDAGVVPVVTLESPEQGIAIGRALLDGGLNSIEVTLRSAAGIPAIERLKRDLPALKIGAGTVRSVAQLTQLVSLGVDFIVTPGTPPALADVLGDCPVPVVPGGATATEFMTLLDLGFDCVKFFPAVPSGGLPLIKSLAGPLADLIICPTGGISESSAPDFLRQANVACVGGSWMVAPEWLAQGQYEQVRESSQRARALADAAKPGRP